MPSSDLERIFGPGGELSRAHPHYEPRPGQLEMARAVALSLEAGKHLLVEAGTGTGKTLAYLVPAVLSGLRVVVSTGTKTLQDRSSTATSLSSETSWGCASAPRR